MTGDNEKRISPIIALSDEDRVKMRGHICALLLCVPSRLSDPFLALIIKVHMQQSSPLLMYLFWN